MDRPALGQALNLSVELIPAHMDNRPGRRMQPTSVTVHNTSNAGKGADAGAHSRFVRNTGHYVHKGKKRWVSWHYTVDDTEVIKHLPINEVAFHAGRKANSSSIAIETCMHKGIDQAAADARLAKLVAVLLFDLKLTTDDVKPHKHWTGKNCPVLILKEWDDFIAEVDRLLKEVKTAAPADPLCAPAEEFSFDGAVRSEEEVEDFDIDHDAFDVTA